MGRVRRGEQATVPALAWRRQGKSAAPATAGRL